MPIKQSEIMESALKQAGVTVRLLMFRRHAGSNIGTSDKWISSVSGVTGM